MSKKETNILITKQHATITFYMNIYPNKFFFEFKAKIDPCIHSSKDMHQRCNDLGTVSERGYM